MTFYEMLSSRYDTVFPFSPDTFAFLETHAVKGRPVLDLGAATGAYVAAFQKAGYDAVGIEYDEALAKKSPVELIVGDMRDIPAPPEPTFGLVTCIGNTLVHLPVKEAKGVIGDVAARLVPGGAFVVQILNYDRIIAENVTDLPTIEADGVVFERSYVLKEGEIEFFGRLIVDEAPYVSSVTLYPLMMDDLEDAAGAAGLTMETFGDFSGTPWTKDSFMTVAVMRR